jgi:hypothetical protein
MSSRHRHQFTTFMTDPKRSANEEIILYRGISRLLSRICIMCSQGAPWRRTLRCTGSCPSSTAQSNPTPCNQSNGSTQGIAWGGRRAHAHQRRLTPVHMVCVGKANEASDMHERACNKRAHSVRERNRERNREILSSSRGRWSRAGLTCVVTHKLTNAHTHTHTQTHTHTHMQTYKSTHKHTDAHIHTNTHTNSIRSARHTQMEFVCEGHGTHTDGFRGPRTQTQALR